LVEARAWLWAYKLQPGLSCITKQPTVPAAACATTEPPSFHGHVTRKFKRTAHLYSAVINYNRLVQGREGAMWLSIVVLKSHLILPVCNGRKIQDRREEQLSSRNKVWMLNLY